MELKIDINYAQILFLVKQLPKEQIEDLYFKLKTEIQAKKANNIQELILSAPTWSDSDYQAYKESRELLNNSRLA